MAQTALSKYRPGKGQEGTVYFLPKTAVRVSILVEKTTYKPGDFSAYAMRYLRINSVSQTATTTYRIAGISQTAIALADTAKAYTVKYDTKTVASNIILSDDGRLLGINGQPKEENTKITAFQPAPKPAPLNPRKYMSEEILAAGSTAKMAELTALEIYDLRENRNLLIKGQADFMPKDGAQLRLMLDNLDRQDRALSELFTGTTTVDTTEVVLAIIPDSPMEKTVLFRLSQKLGLVEADDLSGTPYYIAIDDISRLPRTEPDPKAAKKKVKQPESGIYVNVPGKMRSTISYQGQTIDTAELPAPQFGNTELLSGELFNKRYTTRLWLNPLTGGVTKLEAELPK
jgi:hypothetical protein